VPWLRGRAVVAVLVLVLVLVAALGGAGGDGLRGPRRLPLIALATVPAVSLLFRPQSRHFLPLLPLAIAIVGTRLRRRPGERHPRLVAALRLAFGGVLLAGLASAWVTWAAPANGAASMDSWIRELREETRARPVRLLASWYGDRVCRLVGPGCRPVSLPEFIDGQEIDAALIGPDWAKRSDVRGDDRLAGFASRPEDLGCQAGAVLPEGFRVVRCHPPLRRRPRPPAASADGRSG
jgi:hypothetical protein